MDKQLGFCPIKLADQIKNIKKEYDGFNRNAPGWVPLGKRIGELLLWAKRNLPHGEFMKFCSEQAGLNDTWVKRFIRMAHFFEGRVLVEIRSKSAFYDIIKPSVSEDKKEQFYKQSKIGKSPAYLETKKLISDEESGSGRKQIYLKTRISLLEKSLNNLNELLVSFCTITEKSKIKIIESFAFHILSFKNEDLVLLRSGQQTVPIIST